MAYSIKLLMMLVMVHAMLTQGAEKIQKKQHHFLLIHGACHGAWCWYKVATLLRSCGHKVTTLDLQASGINPVQVHDVSTFEEFTSPLLEFLRTLPEGKKVILVGHSLGGINIAYAMDRHPDKILAAVFASAFMPDTTNRRSFVLEKYINSSDPNYLLDTKYGFDKGVHTLPTTILFGPRAIEDRLYQLSSDKDKELAKTLLRASPYLLPDLVNSPPFSKDGYGSVDTFFIECTYDLAIPIDYQRVMIANHPVKLVKKIEADHMMMLSRPEKLHKCLVEIAESYED